MNDDLISRQAAIELIHSLYPSAPIMRRNREWWEKKYKPYIEAEKALEMLPSAQPELKKGKWMHLGGDEWCCSACGEIECTEGSWEHPLKDRGWKYCRTCGARMDEE